MEKRNLMAIGLGLVILTTGCDGESKKVQCGKFTKVTADVAATLKSSETPKSQLNTTANTIEGFQKLAADSAEIFTQRAARIDQAVKIIESLGVTDDRLKTLKTEYLSATKKAADATRAIAIVYTAKSKATAQTITDPGFKQLDENFNKAVSILTAAGKEETQLISNLNAYCVAK